MLVLGHLGGLRARREQNGEEGSLGSAGLGRDGAPTSENAALAAAPEPTSPGHCRADAGGPELEGTWWSGQSWGWCGSDGKETGASEAPEWGPGLLGHLCRRRCFCCAA